MSVVQYRPGRLGPEAEQPPRTRRAPGRPRAADAVDDEGFLEAALRAFAVGGYDGVSVRTLSKQLGVSSGWVNQRYGSKERLWYAAVDHGFGRQAATIAFDPTVSDPLEQLANGIRQFLHYTAQHPELGLIMNSEGARDTERLDYIYDHYIAPLLAPVDRLLRHLADEGRIDPVPLRTFFLLVAQGGGAPFGLLPLARRVERGDPTTRKNLDTHIEAVTRIITNGLRAR